MVRTMQQRTGALKKVENLTVDVNVTVQIDIGALQRKDLTCELCKLLPDRPRKLISRAGKAKLHLQHTAIVVAIIFRFALISTSFYSLPFHSCSYSFHFS